MITLKRLEEKGSSMVKVITAIKETAYASYRYLHMCTHKQTV